MKKIVLFVLLAISIASCTNSKFEKKWKDGDNYLFLHSGGDFDGYVLDRFMIGTWNVEDEKSLVLNTCYGERIVLKIWSVSDKQLVVSVSQVEDESFCLNAVEQNSVSSDYRYWKEDKNRWRIRPMQAETTKQIYERTLASLQNTIDYLHYSKEQPQNVFSLTPAAIPFWIAQNGIQLDSYMDEQWVECFYSKQQAGTGHKFLRMAMDDYISVDNELSPIDLNISLLEQVKENMEEAYKKYEELYVAEAIDYNDPKLNVWQQKPSRPETDDELRKRVKNVLDYSIAYISTERLTNAVVPYHNMPLPIYFGDNGMELQSSMKQEWVGMFYDESDATSAYNILKDALFSDIKIPQDIAGEELNMYLLGEVSKAVEKH